MGSIRTLVLETYAVSGQRFSEIDTPVGSVAKSHRDYRVCLWNSNFLCVIRNGAGLKMQESRELIYSESSFSQVTFELVVGHKDENIS
jgi:hypothetical protein